LSDVRAMELNNMAFFIEIMREYSNLDKNELRRLHFFDIFGNLSGYMKDKITYFFFEFSVNNIILYGRVLSRNVQELLDYYKWVLIIADRFEIVYNQQKAKLTAFRPKGRSCTLTLDLTNSSKDNSNWKSDIEINKYNQWLKELDFSGKKAQPLSKHNLYKEMMDEIPNTRAVLLHEIQILQQNIVGDKHLFQQNTISPSEVVKTNNQIKADHEESADWTRKRYSRSKIGAFFFEKGTDPKLCRKKADDLIQKYPTVFSKDLETRTYRIDKDKFKQICADCKLPYPNGIV
jgi:hypothetical protein